MIFVPLLENDYFDQIFFNIIFLLFKLSVYPVELGRTCDDPHTLLLDSQFEMSRTDNYSDDRRKNANSSNINLEWQQQEEPTPNCNNIPCKFSDSLKVSREPVKKV